MRVRLRHLLPALSLLVSACSAQPDSNTSLDDSKYNFDYSSLTDSIEVYRKGCDAEDDVACAKLGMAYLNQREDDLAMPLLDEACRDGFGLLCHSLGMKFRVSALDKPREERSEDYSLSVEYFSKACDASHFEGCRMLANAYEESEGLANDASLAFTLYERACDNNNARACDRLGTAYEHAQHVERDQEKAVKYYAIACEQNESSACRSLHLHHVRLCESGSASDCITVSKYYEDGIGLGHDYLEWHRLGNAGKYYARACDLGELAACNKSKNSYSRACKMGNEEACIEIE